MHDDCSRAVVLTKLTKYTTLPAIILNLVHTHPLLCLMFVIRDCNTSYWRTLYVMIMNFHVFEEEVIAIFLNNYISEIFFL